MPIPSEEDIEAARSELQKQKGKGSGSILPKERMLDRLGDLFCAGIIIHDYWMAKIVEKLGEGSHQQ